MRIRCTQPPTTTMIRTLIWKLDKKRGGDDINGNHDMIGNIYEKDRNDPWGLARDLEKWNAAFDVYKQ
jgi:hypothetical protein